MSLVSRSQQDGVLVLCLAEPVLSVALLDELGMTLDELTCDPARLPLVLTSAHGRIFLAGASLCEIATLDPATSLPYAGRGREVLDRLARLPVPTVAAVHGACAGGGLDLALSCDLVVAAPQADLSHPGVRRGLVTGWGGTVLVPATVGSAEARRALLEGSPLATVATTAAGDALDRPQEVVAVAVRAARQLASCHPVRLRLWRALREGQFVDRFRTFVVHNEL